VALGLEVAGREPRPAANVTLSPTGYNATGTDEESSFNGMPKYWN